MGEGEGEMSVTRCTVTRGSMVVLILLLGLTQQAMADTPEDVVTEGLDEWTVGGGFVYWAHRCANTVECDPDPFLKRKPLNGGDTLTVETGSPLAPDLFMFLGADDDGVFYLDQEQNRIEFHPTENPTAAPRVLYTGPGSVTTNLVSDATHVYWGATNGIYRAAKSGAGGARMIATAAVVDLVVDDDGVYWANAEQAFRMPRCASWPACTIEAIAYTDVHSMYRDDGGEYFVGTYLGNDSIRSFLTGGGISGYYHAAAGVNIGRLTSDSDQSYFFWVESTSAQDILKRMERAGSHPVDDLAWVTPGLILRQDSRIFTDDNYVYFYFMGEGVQRLPLDASPVARDLAVNTHMEITQGLQSFDTDVPLVADKATYVRVWGYTSWGPASNGVEATLWGFHDGLPGSSTEPLNGTKYMWPGSDSVPDRNGTTSAWLFRLPSAWTSEGNLRLVAEVDEREMFDDIDRVNNETEQIVEFISRPPACMVFIPVRTNKPKPSIHDPNVEHMFDRFRAVWPTHELKVYTDTEPVEELQVCWWGIVPYPCFGPYEIPDDSGWAIASLVARDTFTDDPDECDSAGARTHYMGMVHPDTNTGTVNGTGNLCLAASWVKMAPHDPPPEDRDWTWPSKGFTLAHETAHNYNRSHVDCGGPDDPDYSYPYDPCQLSFSNIYDTRSHFGFDPRSLLPVNPHDATDLMTYDPLRWISDWQFKHLFVATNRFSVWDCVWDQICGCHDGVCIDCPWQKGWSAESAAEGSRQPPWAVDLRSTRAVVLVNGFIGPQPTAGEIGPVWVYPSAKASDGLLSKWAERAAPTIAEAPPSRDVSYSICLRSSSGVLLDERAIEVREVPDPDSPDYIGAFSASFPEPSGTVARVELTADGAVIDSRDVGQSTPTISLTSPTGGFWSNQISVRWTASDADADDWLWFTVQYSWDSGVTWRAVATDLPKEPDTDQMEWPMVLAELPASLSTGSSRVRVVATDGFHTAVDTSPGFTVRNRVPQPYITEPIEGQTIPAGQLIEARGGARDPDETNLTGSALQWGLDGVAIGSGEDVQIAGLAPGSYELELSASDSKRSTVSTTVDMEIGPLTVPSMGGDPKLDGFCDDAHWAGAARVQLKPYSDGHQATAHFLRSSDYLWVCFTGLKRGTGGPTAFAGLRVDGNYSQDSWAQITDYGFFVDESGTAYTRAGNGGGGFSNTGPSGFVARVSANDVVWSAELRIESTDVGGWDHVAAFDAGHYWVGFQGDDYHWPYDAAYNQPQTWATTSLGVQPHISSTSPSEVVVGGSSFDLWVAGSGFVSGVLVRWNGSARTTTRYTSTLLRATIGSSDIDTVGTAIVTVTNSGLTSSPSNGIPVEIKNPQPSITTLSPSSVDAESGGFTLQVNGSGFASGATVLWNGKARTTSYVTSSLLNATISADDVASGRTVDISVENPTPQIGTSNIVQLEVVPNVPTVAGDDVSICESAGAALVTFSFSPTPESTVSFDYETVNGSATAPGDYTTTFGTKTVPAWSTTTTVTIPINNDSANEGYETFAIHLDNATGAIISDDSVSVTIVDQDGLAALPGDGSADCGYDAADAAVLVRELTDAAYTAPGNPDCTMNGSLAAEDMTCLVARIF